MAAATSFVRARSASTSAQEEVNFVCCANAGEFRKQGSRAYSFELAALQVESEPAAYDQRDAFGVEFAEKVQEVRKQRVHAQLPCLVSGSRIARRTCSAVSFDRLSPVTSSRYVCTGDATSPGRPSK